MCGEHWSNITGPQNITQWKEKMIFIFQLIISSFKLISTGYILFFSVSKKSDCETENALLGRQTDTLDRAKNLELEELVSTESWITSQFYFFTLDK